MVPQQTGFVYTRFRLDWLMLVVLFLAGMGVAAYVQSDRIRAVELLSLDGTPIKLPGEQLTWVNFWSIHCPPCLEELPYLDNLHREYRGRVQIVAVSVPYDPPNEVLEYREREQLSLPMALDLESQALRQFTDNLVVPSHYLLDKNGKILLSHLGELDEQAIRGAIEQHF